jgi:hypothetical protein
MRAFARGLALNLAAGLRVALFLPVRRLAFRVDVPQLLALFVVSALVDIGADAMRYGEGAAFSWYGLGNEVYSGGVLLLSAAVLALVNRDRSLTLAIPVIALSTFPVLQFANGLPWDRWGLRGDVAGVVENAVLAWILVSLARIVYVALEYRPAMRLLRAIGGGIVLAAPIFLSNAIMPLEPWFAPIARGAADPRFPNPASEPVLTEQARILDEMLSELDDGRPGVADLYFVGFAGDATEPAFRGDVEAARRVMDERWGTGGRSILLVNDARTLLTDPIATLSHLRDTLEEVANAMDADEDVVMVYLAAPGTPNRELDVRMPPLELVPITPARLRGALDDAGIRYSVIVVSACYAGGFVDELADDETAVIVASASDAASPGCGVRGDTTVFGDAFFQDGMSKSATVDDAFEIAQASVRLRERAEGMSPAATPQSRIGAGIAAKLAELRRRGGVQQEVRLPGARHG